MRVSASSAWRLVLLAAAGALLGGPQFLMAADYECPITLHEPLGFTWTDELIHRDEKIAQPHVSAAAFALEDPDGRAAALQVEVLEGKPDDVRKVRLWFKATLPQGKEVSYRLTYNDDGRKAEALDGLVTVRREGDRLVVGNGRFEVAVAAPAGPFAKPLDLAAAPAPILGVRPVGGKSWRSQWSLQGPVRVREIRTTVAAEGPVWAEVRLKYILDGRDQAYDVVLRFVRGEPWVDVLEKSRLPAGCRMTAVMRLARRPAEATWMPWFIYRDGRLQSAYDVQRLVLDDKVRPGVASAEPGSALAKPGEVVATLRPRWTQAHDNTQVLLAQPTEVGVRHDAEPAGPPLVVGAAMIGAGDWVKPYDQFPTVRLLDGRDGLAVDFPLAEGQRRWALVAGPADQLDTKAKLQRLIRKNADIPLDRVLGEWVFQWPRDADNPAPHILTTWLRLQQIRDDLAAGRDTAAVRLIKRAESGGAAADQAVVDYLVGRREELGPANVAARLYLERSFQDDFFNPTTYPRRLAAAMRLADLAYPGRPGGDAMTALAGYIFSDPDYWPGYAGGWDAGNPALHAEMCSVLLSAAAAIPDHPAARRWMAAAVAGLHDAVRRAVAMPSGAGVESPGQTARTLASMLGPMQAAASAGGEDPFRWPEVRACLEFLRNLHTPPDPRLGRRDLAPIGEAQGWQDETGLVFGMAAQGLEKIDPKLAALYMGIFRNYYGDKGSGDLLRDVLRVDQSLSAARLEDGDWSSKAYRGFGAVLRSAFGTPHETFATLKCGPSRGHYQGDELGFHFYGAGMPIALDWHCGPTLRPEQEHMHNRVNVGDNENMDAVGDLVATAFMPAGDLAVGQLRSDRLRKMPRLPQEIEPHAAYPRRTLEREVRYRRYLLLVKHPGAGADGDRGPLEDYLVIRDEVTGGEPSTFNLFVLARSMKQDDQTFRFDGQLAADATVFFATPDVGQVKGDRWGWPRPDDSGMVPKNFRIGTDTWRGGELQQWLRVSAAPGQPFLAVLYPHRKGTVEPKFESLAGGRGVRVSLGGASEEVYLSTDPAPGIGAQAAIRRGGQTTVILRAGALPPV